MSDHDSSSRGGYGRLPELSPVGTTLLGATVEWWEADQWNYATAGISAMLVERHPGTSDELEVAHIKRVAEWEKTKAELLSIIENAEAEALDQRLAAEARAKEVRARGGWHAEVTGPTADDLRRDFGTKLAYHETAKPVPPTLFEGTVVSVFADGLHVQETHHDGSTGPLWNLPVTACRVIQKSIRWTSEREELPQAPHPEALCACGHMALHHLQGGFGACPMSHGRGEHCGSFREERQL